MKTKSWLEAGLISKKADRVAYLKENDYFYPLEKRKEIKKLDLSHENLTGVLDLSDFINLEELQMSSNQISDVNFLQQLPNPEKLRMLDLASNNISSDLKPFSRFTNLEELILGERFGKKGDNIQVLKLNGFHGSLELLKNLTKLKKLDISNTDLDKGLEYLPESIEEFYFSADLREDAKQKGHDSSETNTKKLRKEYEKHIEKENAHELSKEIIEQLEEFDHNRLTSEQKLLVKKLIPNKELRRRYKKGGLCLECKQPNTWAYRKKVDKFIQKSQSEVANSQEVLEWIPYEQFEIEKDEQGNNKVLGEEREEDKEIVLKVLNDSKNITADFLKEVANHKVCSSKFILPLYGISREPNGNYVMVMDYMDKGDLRKILRNEDIDLYGLERIMANYQELPHNTALSLKICRESDDIEIPQYQAHPEASRHSKLINTREISKISHAVKDLKLDVNKIDEEYILEQLTNSIKDKLKSKSLLSKDKRKVREEKLEALFKAIPETPEEFIKELENIKPGLSKKITAEKISELLSIKSELISKPADSVEIPEEEEQGISYQAQQEIPPK
ncbi:20088_t:CDS:2 [Gigaspora margarita]|uniref:20088_t:CDS:1 n=1 Tax=Gigaspora margarita TaxID=4874 RepID=A0ABN7UM14_GIGMA|nr:20088_t:CDS:2 [Gigaspora margarita]